MNVISCGKYIDDRAKHLPTNSIRKLLFSRSILIVFWSHLILLNEQWKPCNFKHFISLLIQAIICVVKSHIRNWTNYGCPEWNHNSKNMILFSWFSSKKTWTHFSFHLQKKIISFGISFMSFHHFYVFLYCFLLFFGYSLNSMLACMTWSNLSQTYIQYAIEN